MTEDRGRATDVVGRSLSSELRNTAPEFCADREDVRPRVLSSVFRLGGMPPSTLLFLLGRAFSEDSHQRTDI